MSYALYLQTQGKLIPFVTALFGITTTNTTSTNTSTMPSLSSVQPLSPISTSTGWKLPAIPFNSGTTPVVPGMPNFSSGTMK